MTVRNRCPCSPQAHADAGRVPRVRHHAARRVAAGGSEPLGGRQAGHRRACSTSWAWTSSRAAGPAPTRATPRSSRRWPTAPWRCATRHLVAFGFTRRVGMRAADDPLTAALRDSRAPYACIVAKSHDRHVEQALRTTLDENLAMITDTVQPPARRGPAGLRGLRALLRRLPGEPGVRARGRPDRRRGRAPRSSCSATPTAACCRPGSREIVGATAGATGAQLGIHCPQRHRLRGGQHPGRRRRRRDARPGHRQRLRRADRQRRPGLGRRQPGTQVRLAAASGRLAARGDPPRARDRRGDERSTERSSALRWSVVVRPQGGPARQRDQGRSQPLPAHRSGAGRQRHADARLRHGRPGQHPDQG